MRVTTGMLIDGVLRDLRVTWSRLANYEQQLASAKRILKPSDDPVGTVRSLGLRSELSRLHRYLDNVEDGRDWVEITDTALAQAADILQRTRELAVTTAGTAPPSTLQAVEAEVTQLFQQLAEVGNTAYGGRYVFAGHLTATPPFAVALDPSTDAWEFAYQGDGGTISREVGPGVRLPVNRPGDQALGVAFAAVRDYLNALRAARREGTPVPQQVLADLDAALDQLLEERARVGADGHRLELARSRLQDSIYQVTSLLSETEDADMAEVIVRLTSTEAAYRAALEAGARIIQPSLLDFLR